MEKPITNKLEELINNKVISMHVPGHKNMTIGNLNQLKINMDMTEITGLDDMHQPEDIILESMSHFKKHDDYDAFLLINGTTSGILSVIQAFSEKKGQYLISRNVHKSVFHGLDLAKAQATFTAMHQSNLTCQYVEPILEDVIEDYKLGICTYPNYYGETFNIGNFINKLHDNGIPVLVDEAHGAHFDLEGFPISSMNYGADYVVQSYHKTLPALTMGSVLFIHKDAPLRSQVIEYLSYFQTSSPSYLVMSSLEYAQEFYNEFKSELFFEKRKHFIKVLKKKGFNIGEPDDAVKLVVSYDGFEGYDIQRWFEDYNIFVELVDEHQILLVLPLWHENDVFPFELLIKTINEMEIPERAEHAPKKLNLMLASSEYRAVHFPKVKEIAIHQAEGEVLAQHIVPYPPGIPVMFRGEVITTHMIKLLQHYSNLGIKVEGLKDQNILVKDE
ncbi:aminotransferase class I/II-fold pyridoxal phosphate-dependent enzyme [Staphylococcus capitis]|uniref:aminotransferase class I/II-fold pyridoxal phosphate-dependent enzyme n=1 Tax=Staphylococcus capitis TaxID=29388 RepID=UPI000715AD61|nr:aminotransferase class I/II-fold pyridoxal phosphate-dependent enzyme [Staphylococcus capitis]MCC3745152.1 aminotransferase class I/II-fold pyridoxal phosphate-dependent enzyme [Staphylococcus capitis]MDS0931146.1 aminotransferase class I/II-fold pyridoxal phosphate-dependent enzyme [Staphylococcus capitis]CUT93696.1 Orn/Lys/Arg decarboxylase, major domain protein [Staphylococcus capitis]